MIVLIDRAAWGHPAVWMAALRRFHRETPVDLYVVVEEPDVWEAIKWAWHQPVGSVRVLTTPDRDIRWSLIGQTDGVDRWLLQRYDTRVDSTKVRGWLQKYGSLQEMDPSRHRGYQATIQTAQAEQSELLTGTDWEPDLGPYTVVSGDQGEVSAGRDYHRVTEDNADDLLAELRDFRGPVALDFETEGPYPLGVGIIGFSYALHPGRAYYAPLAHRGEGNISAGMGRRILEAILAHTWIAHNAKYEYQVLRNAGYRPSLPHDTMVMAWLLGYERGLKSLALSQLGEPMTTYGEVTGDDPEHFSAVPVHKAVRYGAADSDMTLRLFEHLQQDPDWPSVASLYEDLERPLMLVLADMERKGLPLDFEWLEAWKGELDESIATAESDLWDSLDLPAEKRGNLNADRYVQWLLFEHLGMEPQRFTAGGYSVDEATINALLGAEPTHPTLLALLAYRERTKLRGTYAVGLSDRGRIHGSGRIHPRSDGTGTRFGRLSSADPNGQNIPPVARRAVRTVGDDRFAAADYGQVELRIGAHLSQDPILLDTFKRGISPHLVTYQRMFHLTDKEQSPDKYKVSKNVNFGSLYGIGALTLIDTLRKEGVYLPVAESAAYLREHAQTYPRLYEYKREVQEELLATGRIRTLQGKIIRLPEVWSADSALVAEALRQGFNGLIQGTAGIGTKAAMVNFARTMPGLLRLNIHDELIVETTERDAPDVLQYLQSVMVASLQPLVTVPIVTEGKIADTWSKLK